MIEMELNPVKKVLQSYEAYKIEKKVDDLEGDLQDFSERVNDLDSEVSMELEIDRMMKKISLNFEVSGEERELNSRIDKMISVYTDLKGIEDELKSKIDDLSEEEWVDKAEDLDFEVCEYKENLRDLLSKVGKRQKLIYNKTRGLFLRDYKREKELGKDLPEDLYYIG